MQMKEIGNIVMLHRKHSGLSRIKLANLAGVGKTVIYDIEHGKETVQYAGLRKVLETLNIKIHMDSPAMALLKSKITKDEENETG